MTSNNLIYTISYSSLPGTDNRKMNRIEDMTKLCIKSIRDLGKYNDDILIFTDSSTDYDDLDVDIVNFSPQPNNIFNVVIMKARAREYFDSNKYDSIMYMDTDIIAINNINKIFEYSTNQICFGEEFPYNLIVPVDEALRPHNPVLTKEESNQLKGVPRINSGLFVCDQSIYDEYMQIFENYMLEYQHIKSETGERDQNYITTAIIREDINYQHLPHGWIEFPTVSSKNGPPPIINNKTKFLHFPGQDYGDRLKNMEQSYKQARNNINQLNEIHHPNK